MATSLFYLIYLIYKLELLYKHLHAKRTVQSELCTTIPKISSLRESI